MNAVTIVRADLDQPLHQQHTLEMLDAYSADPMGDAKPLSKFAKQYLIEGLRKHPTTLIFLAYRSSSVVGIATCFIGFSTFAAKSLINISDYFVLPEHRGAGIGGMLLDVVEKEARSLDCCRITLEVQSNNIAAKSIYTRKGFAQAVYPADASGGGSIYMMKKLD